MRRTPTRAAPSGMTDLRRPPLHAAQGTAPAVWLSGTARQGLCHRDPTFNLTPFKQPQVARAFHFKQSRRRTRGNSASKVLDTTPRSDCTVTPGRSQAQTTPTPNTGSSSHSAPTFEQVLPGYKSLVSPTICAAFPYHNRLSTFF